MRCWQNPLYLSVSWFPYFLHNVFIYQLQELFHSKGPWQDNFVRYVSLLSVCFVSQIFISLNKRRVCKAYRFKQGGIRAKEDQSVFYHSNARKCFIPINFWWNFDANTIWTCSLRIMVDIGNRFIIQIGHTAFV